VQNENIFIKNLNGFYSCCQVFKRPSARRRLWGALDTPIFAYYLTIQELVGKGHVGCFDKPSTNGKINHFNMRIPTQTGHPFRTKPATYSVSNRPGIPEQTSHP